MTESTKTKGRTTSIGATFSIIAVAVVLFMLVYIPTGPLKKYRRSAAEVQSLREQLRDARGAKQAELARLSSQEELAARLQARDRAFDLWAFLNKTLTETRLKDRAVLQNYRPRRERRAGPESAAMVELRLNNITLNEFVELLHKVYASQNLVVLYELGYLRAAANQKGLECQVILLSPKADEALDS